MNRDNPSTEVRAKEPEREPYEPPELKYAGSVADLTRGTGTAPKPPPPGVRIYGRFSAREAADIMGGLGSRDTD
jgi:hypothetical protein